MTAAERTPPPRFDRNARRQVVFFIVLLALVWVASAVIFWRNDNSAWITTRALAQLKRFESSPNPEADAAAAAQAGDFKLFVIDRGEGQRTPGVLRPELLRSRMGFRLVVVPATKDQDHLHRIAIDYAYRYNAALVKRAGPLTQPTTVPSETTRPSTTQASP